MRTVADTLQSSRHYHHSPNTTSSCLAQTATHSENNNTSTILAAHRVHKLTPLYCWHPLGVAVQCSGWEEEPRPGSSLFLPDALPCGQTDGRQHTARPCDGLVC